MRGAIVDKSAVFPPVKIIVWSATGGRGGRCVFSALVPIIFFLGVMLLPAAAAAGSSAWAFDFFLALVSRGSV